MYLKAAVFKWFMERERFIGEEWQNENEILNGLREGLNSAEDLQDAYGMDTAELVNYVAEELLMDEEDIERVRQVFENGKCPYCVEENYEKAVSGDVNDTRVDPTLGKYVWTDKEEGHKVDAGELVTTYLAAKCENGHDDAFVLYEESWYTDDGANGGLS